MRRCCAHLVAGREGRELRSELDWAWASLAMASAETVLLRGTQGAWAFADWQ